MRRVMAVLGMVVLWSGRGVLADGGCEYQGAPYLNGSDVCQAGTLYRCETGAWRALTAPCPLNWTLAQRSCEFQGQRYDSGRVTCRADTQRQQVCDNGRWQPLDTPCVAAAGSEVPAASPKSCLYQGARFLPQTIMCRDGTNFICEGGAWENLRTPCQ